MHFTLQLWKVSANHKYKVADFSSNSLLFEGRLLACNKLLEAGGKVDLPDSQGQTALHIAAKYGHEVLIPHFLRVGANPLLKVTCFKFKIFDFAFSTLA